MPSVLAVLFLTFTVVSVTSQSPCTVRKYYIAAENIEWNYFPHETPIYDFRKMFAAPYVETDTGEPRIGTVYTKIVFRGYTDATLTVPTERESWWGILGPLIFAQVCDKLLIFVQNNAEHDITFHTHGAFYDQASEGAYTYDSSKDGNLISPGESYTYELDILPELGPTASDPDFVIMAYHSHFDGDADIITGLVGPMIICKEGTIGELLLTPVYALLFMVFDENLSWYFDKNLKRLGNLSDSEIEELRRDPNFQESNRKYSINGLIYDNIPGMTVCRGVTTLWHIIGFGGGIDLHNIAFGEHSLVYNEHRNDRVHVTPGIFLTAAVTSNRMGLYSVSSAVGDFYLNGMQANFTVINCNENRQIESPEIKRVRRYYLAIEEILWDYAPTGKNMMTGLKLEDDSEVRNTLFRSNCRNSTVYKKAVFRKYTDESFSQRQESHFYMGLLGPTLHVEVGELLEIELLNMASMPFNLYSLAFPCLNCGPERRVPVLPGKKKTYEYIIDETNAPTDTDPPCVNFHYTSGVDPYDQFAGLIGVLRVCELGALDSEGNLNDIEEYNILFGIMNELNSPYADENFAMVPKTEECNEGNFFFTLAHSMHVINGWIYGNLFGLEFCQHKKVLINILSLNDESQMHVIRIEENMFNHNGLSKSNIELAPGDHKQIFFSPDVIGKFKINCHITGHLNYGMIGFYSVVDCLNREQEPIWYSGTERQYYIAAVEIENWDYAPEDMIHPITGEDLRVNRDSSIFVVQNDTFIGHIYKKAAYREFTDETFTKEKKHPQHFGLNGPFIRAEVGDMIKITFKNLASKEYNMQPEGLFTFQNGTTPPVKPGGVAHYIWIATEKSGPAKNGFSSVVRLYSSTVNIVGDTESGLYGLALIYRPGTLQENGWRIDGVKEFPTVFFIIDENESHYLDYNIKTHADEAKVNRNSESFYLSNLKFSINGKIYGGLKGLDFCQNDQVVFYICGLGNVDIHTAHFHGIAAIEKSDDTLPFGHIEDVTEIFPGICKTLLLRLNKVGKWLYHCHVDEHMRSGMIAEITVHAC